MDSIDPLKKQNLLRKVVLFEFFTIIYCIIEGLLRVWAGIISGSSSLEAFGIDSLIESISACVIIWRYKKLILDQSEKGNVEFEHKSQKYIAYSFFLFGIFIIWEAIEKIYLQEEPTPILFGIIVALISLLVMPFFAWQKYQAGKQLQSRAIIADAKQTFICAIFSGILFLGLFINYTFAIWWIDSAASLVIAFYMLNEGRELMVKMNEQSQFV